MSSPTAAEFRRLAALYALGLLDTESEAEYDGIVKVAAFIANCPIAAISLVDVDRLWMKAAKGLAVKQVSRDYSFCSEMIKGDAPLIVSDARDDSRFCLSPLVTGAPGVRFYLGFPVVFGGERLGALSVIDLVPRELNEEQISMLSELAGTVSALFESRQRFQVMGERDQLLEKLSEEVPGVIYQFRRDVDGKYSMPFATSRLPQLVGVRPKKFVMMLPGPSTPFIPKTCPGCLKALSSLPVLLKPGAASIGYAFRAIRPDGGKDTPHRSDSRTDRFYGTVMYPI